MAISTDREQGQNTTAAKIDLGDGLNQSIPTQETRTVNMGNKETFANAIPTLSFGGRNFTTMTSGLGSEYLNKVHAEFKNIFAGETNHGGYKLNVTPIDNENISNLAYSSIVVSVAKNNKVTYFIVLLESTGRKPLDATAIMQGLNSVGPMNNYKSNDIYVSSDAIDKLLHNEVIKQLESIYSPTHKFYSVDAVIIPYYNISIDAATIRPIASTAYNACIVEIGKLNKEFNDMNITAAVDENKTSYLKIDSNMLPSVNTDAAGKPVRSDFQIELSSIDSRNNLGSMNLQNGKNVICRTGGFIDAMPIESTVPAMQGMNNMAAPASMIRFRPHIIINNLEVDMPTVGYSLLALASSVVMARPGMWLAAVTPKSTDEVHDIGELNLLTNLENKQDGLGDRIDFRDPSVNSNELYGLVKQMYSLEPMFSIDVELYGPQTSYTSIFNAASAPGISTKEADAKYNAGRSIINTANWLTNNIFPKDYDVNKIFLNSGIVVPTGRWTDKNGNVRDIKDVDMSFIAKVAAPEQKVELLNKWALSNVPHSISGLDPYVTKIEIISKLIPNAEITGKAVRATFSPEFLSYLTSSCAQAGFETRYDPEITYNEQSNIAELGNYLQNAGVSQSSADFARAYQTGVNYQTPFANIGGVNRY